MTISYRARPSSPSHAPCRSSEDSPSITDRRERLRGLLPFDRNDSASARFSHDNCVRRIFHAAAAAAARLSHARFLSRSTLADAPERVRLIYRAIVMHDDADERDDEDSETPPVYHLRPTTTRRLKKKNDTSGTTGFVRACQLIIKLAIRRSLRCLIYYTGERGGGETGFR